MLVPECFGEAEIRVTHHSENGSYSPVDHGLDHDVGDGARNTKWRCGYVERDVDAIVAAFDRIRLNAVVVASRRFAGERVVIPPVPRTTEETFLDRALAERSFLVGHSLSRAAYCPW